MNPAELANLTLQLRLVTKALRQLGEQTPPVPEPDLPLPERFSGSRVQYEHFRLDCELMFALKPRTYAQDFVKVRSAILWMTGRAKTWAHQLLLTNSPSLLTWGSFLEAMDSWMVRPRARSSGRAPVPVLKPVPLPRKSVPLQREGRKCTAVIPASGGGGEAMETGLASPRVSRVTRPTVVPRASMPSPERFSSPAATASVPRPDLPDYHMDSQSEGSLADSRAMSVEDYCPAEEPMELGCVRLSALRAAQDRRRALGLCFYCGNEGHYISFCPVRPNRPVRLGVTSLGPVASPQPLVSPLKDCGLKPHKGSTYVDRSPDTGPSGSSPLVTPGVLSPVVPVPPLGDSQKRGIPDLATKALLASHAVDPNPGEVTPGVTGLPGLSTPRLLTRDPYTKEDPCPLSRDIDGTLVRTLDVKPQPLVPDASLPLPPVQHVPQVCRQRERLQELEELLETLGSGENVLTVQEFEERLREADRAASDLLVDVQGNKEADQGMLDRLTEVKTTLQSQMGRLRHIRDMYQNPDKYTEDDSHSDEDPNPVTQASDGTFILEADLEAYEASLTRRPKKSKNHKKKTRKR